MLKSITILLTTLFLCCCCNYTAMAQNTQIIRNPYLQSGTSSSIVLKWRTSQTTDSQVWYGSSPNQLLHSKKVSTYSIDHEVKISNLRHNTTYYYAVGDSNGQLIGGDYQHYFTTAPTTGTNKATVAWILGDAGTGTSEQRAVRDAYYNYIGNKHTDMILLLGDNAYETGTDAEYQGAIFDAYTTKLANTHLWSVPGNHDYYKQSGLNADYYDIFTFPTKGEAGGLASNTEKYYAFDYGNIHFISLDSQDENKEMGSPMLTWLENDLATTNQEWIVVMFHHPPYSKGSHDSDTEIELKKMRNNVLPLLDDYGVDLVLSGHSHAYERTKLIQGHYGSSNTYNSNLHAVDGGDGRLDGDGAYQKNASGEGIVYIVTGSAGKKSAMKGTHPAMYYAVSRLGSTILEIEGSEMNIKFLNATGEVEDYLTINKNNISTSITDNDGGTSKADCSKVVVNSAEDKINVRGLTAKRAIVQYIGTNTGYATQTVCDGNCNESQTFSVNSGNYTVKIQLFGQDDTYCYIEKKVTVGSPSPNTNTVNCANINIVPSGNSFTISGANGINSILKIFNKDWKPIFECVGTCDNSKIPTNLISGAYWVKGQFYDAQWKLLCEKTVNIDISTTRSTTLLEESMLFPNPVQEHLFIDLKRYVGKNGKLTIANQLGQVMKSVQLAQISEEPTPIYLENYQNGFYFLNIAVDNAPVLVEKFLVSRMY